MQKITILFDSSIHSVLGPNMYMRVLNNDDDV